MRRSEINKVIAEAKDFFARMNFLLPPFAFLGPEELGTKITPDSPIYKGRLGWDVTDFGSGDLMKTGILLFTLRNGDKDMLPKGHGRLYCEKAIMFRAGQSCPSHSHYTKTEDLINRGGGTIWINLVAADEKGNRRTGPSTVLIDEEPITFVGQTQVKLQPGQSILLEPGIYHAIGAETVPVLVGEVSLVNDDLNDNIFAVPVDRFPTIIEDEPPLHLICADYDRYANAPTG